MRTYPFEDDYMPDDDCSCGQCDQHDDIYFDEEDVYDDPHDVVMYDIDEAAANSLYSLILMLEDSAREWYARRKLNSLAASVELQQALVATIIIDSLGRRWNPLLHPRDRHGKFINTGGFFRWLMRGDWQRGQVVRIDSDGTIHALSDGNPNIPDGTPLKFNNKDSAKFIATRGDKASISEGLVDLDADIPGFPEASPNQKRVFNALQFGDMPADDIYKYRVGDDNNTVDFADEIAELRTRKLVDITPGDPARISRTDNDQLGIIDIDEVDAVPSDETPDIEDGPNLTQKQRDILGRIEELELRNNGGVAPSDLPNVSEEELDALVQEGVLDRKENSGTDFYHLPNPENSDTTNISDNDDTGLSESKDLEPSRDPVAEGRAAAEKRFPGNKEQQDVFNERVDELVQGIEVDDADFDRSEMRARNAADAWWEEFNAPDPAQEDNISDVDGPTPLKLDQKKNFRRGRNFLGQFMDEERLDENEDYARAIGDLLHAQDLRENGEDDKADVYEKIGRNRLDKLGVNLKDDEGEDIDIFDGLQAFREDERSLAEQEPDSPEAEDVPSVNAPEEVSVVENDDLGADLPEQTPQENVSEDVPELQPEEDEDLNNLLQEPSRKGMTDWLAEEEQREAERQNIDDVEPSDQDVDVPDENVDDVQSVNNSLPTPRDSDLSSGADDLDRQRLINQPEFWDDKPDVQPEGQVKDRSGRDIVIGDWYKSNRGGGGKLQQVVAIPDQNKYPGLVFVHTGDGEMKLVVANNPNKPLAGLNRIEAPDPEKIKAQRIQRAVANDELLDLDQNNPKNVLFGGEFAEVGMRVGGRRGNGLFQEGDEGVIVRIGWNNKEKRPIIWVKKGDGEFGLNENEIQQAPQELVKLEGPPTFEVPESDQNINDVDAAEIVPGNWGPLQNEQEVAQLLNEIGEVDYVDFINGFENPGAAIEKIQNAINNRLVEIIPGQGVSGRAKIKVRDVTPELPEGADNEVEGSILNQIDGAQTRGLLRGDIVDIDDLDAREKYDAIDELLRKRVIEVVENPINGLEYYRRAPQGPSLPEGAENEQEADILNALDALDGPARRRELIDVDGTSVREKMNALDELIQRGVIRQNIDEDGKPVFSRAQRSSTPRVMSDNDAREALRSGEDPLMIINSNLDVIMRNAGLQRYRNGDAGISPNEWVVGNGSAEFPVRIKGAGEQSGRVYMVKRSSRQIPDDVMNEVMAGAINAELVDVLGRDNKGLLHHPRVGIAEAPTGVGFGAGGAIVMDHAAYGFPEGFEFFEGIDITPEQLIAGGANKDLVKLNLFDFIINNRKDRHDRNQFFARNPDTGQIQVVIIDNGFGFGAAGDESSDFSGFLDEGRPRMLARKVNRNEVGEVKEAVEEFVSAYSNINVAAVMSRLRAIYPDMTPQQEEYARKWFEIAKTRVDNIALDIDGVVDAIINA